MKQTIFSILLITFSLSLFGQKEVILKINHKLGDEVFEYHTEHNTDEGNNFKITRLQYYLSGLSLIHDGGQETIIEDLWILDRAQNIASLHELGSFELDQIEGIKLHVGVDSLHNHLDPALWPADHPLAPKNPSMHWGWAGGYRFFAFEGLAGEDALVNDVQFHGVGNSLYETTTVLTGATEENGTLVISLDADYAEAVRTLDINPGLISHGEIWHAKTVGENFTNLVFSASDGTVSSEDIADLIEVQLFPNPAISGVVNVKTDLQSPTALVNIFAANGVKLSQSNLSNGQATLNINTPGVYMLQFVDNNQLLLTKRLVVR